ncbi:major facilitator superfamily domain-containing protein 8-like [Hydractinia symbiolongicarpus]|uniref:major facilitator superfamily domain-containing protein 8-like n=1 Tax=Hydractinia symbiolongicarpus TaxID=13093 RepID=UPI002549D52B|nr:major facilitator superfamily domain-containing protein 8-like [Hydractinia symbiolongicarpus]XP_057307048.1 major facilitator superfamily domain-containing protein 8-like [Hydractinia symbiolongicarpus]XP_057307049.1 major facilitator superfamily domain-containing protein 8-like [Hydractinia symbiolongicarpus]XP_057307050.1 major facilitator superfamily domain-containing protein 8-like [Hydractinia symbiolongicarpus]
MISEWEFAIWKKKRTSTYVYFIFLFFFIGLEYGCITATLWIYVSTVLQTRNDKFYYGLISAGFFIPSLFFPPIVSRVVDKTRRVKLCVIFIISLSMAGNFLYPIHYHPLFPFFGRFLSGFGAALCPLIISEVARSYEKTDLTQRLPALNGAQMLGYAFGPCISTIFSKANFKIGPIHITSANIIGPILFLFAAVLILATVCFMHDLSREYDLKADTMDNLQEKKNKDLSTTSTMNTLKKIFQTKDTSLILVMSLLFGIAEQIMFRILPILIIDNLHFGYAFFNGSLVVYGLFNSILVFIFVYRKLSNKELYYTGIASFLSLIVIKLLMLLLYYRIGNIYTWYVLIVLTYCSIEIFLLSENTFSVVISVKLAYSCNQSFLESIRLFTLQSGRIIGGLGVGIYYSYMNIYYLLINLMTLLLLISLLLRKKTLSNPSPII